SEIKIYFLRHFPALFEKLHRTQKRKGKKHRRIGQNRLLCSKNKRVQADFHYKHSFQHLLKIMFQQKNLTGKYFHYNNTFQRPVKRFK
ncbi:MAG: hypothetical protein ACE5DO_01800, partial [Desulfobacterales bacterium]